MADKRYRITFKGHRNSERLYVLEAEGTATAHFTAAALRASGWMVVGTPVVIGYYGEVSNG